MYLCKKIVSLSNQESIMEELYAISSTLIKQTEQTFRRFLFNTIDWNQRLIGLKGSRGTGKTTLLLQWLKESEIPMSQKLYLTLDDVYFSRRSLLETGSDLYKKGVKVLVLDEVHKYPNWSGEIKNLYDRYRDLKILFTGSSIIDISLQEGDLSRRALMYELPGLSFREYLELTQGLSFPSFKLEELINQKDEIILRFPNDFKPYQFLDGYLKNGYYPFFMEDDKNYHLRLRQLVRLIVEYDMAELKGFDIRQAKKMLQLLTVIAHQVPFKPNLSKLAQKTGLHRNSIANYLYFLKEARLIDLLHISSKSIAVLQKPEKIYIDNPNLLHAMAEGKPSEGTIREVFVNNQLRIAHKVQIPHKGDFIVDNTITLEVGGKTKKNHQIEGIKDSYLVKDGAEVPFGNTLPIWLFGFLY